MRRYVDLPGAPECAAPGAAQSFTGGLFVVDATDATSTHLAGRTGSAICPGSERTMNTRATTFATALIARTTNAAQRRAVVLGSSRAGRMTGTAFAVALLIGGGAGAARSAPPLCADVLK